MIYIISIILAIVIYVLIQVNAKKKTNEGLTKLGISNSDIIITGKLNCGHPDINKVIAESALAKINETLKILDVGYGAEVMAEIKPEQIKNVIIEDVSTMQSRVTVGRILVTGVFAFAIPKKEKTEISYLIIEWNDGRFDHETIFEFYGVGAIQKANTARNSIIKLGR